MMEVTRSILVREFERFFPDLTFDRVAFHQFENDKQRWHAWALETLIWTCARIDANERKEAFRGYAQAREYRGRNGGFWPSGVCSDAAVDVQNAIERMFEEK